METFFFLKRETGNASLETYIGAFSRVGEAVFPNPTDCPWVSEDAFGQSYTKYYLQIKR